MTDLGQFFNSAYLFLDAAALMDAFMSFVMFYYSLAGHPFRGWPARLRGHKGSGLWKVWTVPSLPSLPRAMSPKRQSAESAGADEPV